MSIINHENSTPTLSNNAISTPLVVSTVSNLDVQPEREPPFPSLSSLDAGELYEMGFGPNSEYDPDPGNISEYWSLSADERRHIGGYGEWNNFQTSSVTYPVILKFLKYFL